MLDVTDVMLVNSVSMTISLFAEREPLVPGAGKVKTATFTAESGKGYFCNTTSGGF